MTGVRKNLLLSNESDKIVQTHRARFLNMDTPIEVEYSIMVDALIELGGSASAALDEEALKGLIIKHMRE